MFFSIQRDILCLGDCCVSICLRGAVGDGLSLHLEFAAFVLRDLFLFSHLYLPVEQRFCSAQIAAVPPCFSSHSLV